MKKDYIVEVPYAPEPIFPEICVVCGQTRSEKLEMITMSDNEGFGRGSFFVYKIIKKAGVGRLVKIPVHDSCAKKIRNRFLKRLLLCVAIFAIIAAVGINIGFSEELSYIIALIVAIPFLYFEIMKTPPVEFNYSNINNNEQLKFVFYDKIYADIFAKLNNSNIKEESD
jgi:hypothetical protein